MKRVAFILLLALCVGTPLSRVLAKTLESPVLRPTKENVSSTNTRPVKDNVPSTDTSGGGKKSKDRKGVLDNMVSQSRKRLDKYRENVTKVESRFIKLKAQGKDVSTMNTHVATIKTQINTVDAAITKMEKEFSSLDVSGDKQTIQKVAHAELEKVRDAFSKLHTPTKLAVEKVVRTQAEVQPTKRPRPSGVDPVEKPNNQGGNNQGGSTK